MDTYDMPYLQRGLVHNDLVITGLDEPTSEVLELLPSLDEEIPPRRRELDRHPFARVASPYVQTGITRAAVNGQEIEIRVEPCEDRVFLAVLHEIRCGRSQQVRPDANG